MANETNVGTSHNLLNYSGVLFNRTDNATPFLSLISGRSRTARSWEFVTSLSYATKGGTSTEYNPISESASLTAPTREFITRTQYTNYCQIFHRAVKLSYGKLSSMGQLSGLNLADAQANPANELDFQVANALAAMRNDVEYAFINGVTGTNDGEDDSEPYATNGILAAVDSNNILAAEDAPLGFWLVAQAMELISASNGDTSNLTLMCNNTHIMQLNADAAVNGLTIVPNGREVNGIRINVLQTPLGDIGLLGNGKVPVGTAALVNDSICSRVDLPVPDKGNFFLEELSKTGAAEDYQLYGQAGLDYGASWYHGKITGLAQTFTAPTYSHKVYVAGGSLESA